MPDLTSHTIEQLVATVSSGQARRMAAMLAVGRTVLQAVETHPVEQQRDVAGLIKKLVTELGCDGVVAILQTIGAASSARTPYDLVWTMPGNLASAGRVTSSWSSHIDNACNRVVCATYNLQASSALWKPLQRAAARLGDQVTVYVDTQAAESGGIPLQELRNRLSPAHVWATTKIPDLPENARTTRYRSHAKFLAVDRNFIIITSANFSLSAEQTNIELGVLLQDPSLAREVERHMTAQHSVLYELQ